MSKGGPMWPFEDVFGLNQVIQIPKEDGKCGFEEVTKKTIL